VSAPASGTLSRKRILKNGHTDDNGHVTCWVICTSLCARDIRWALDRTEATNTPTVDCVPNSALACPVSRPVQADTTGNCGFVPLVVFVKRPSGPKGVLCSVESVHTVGEFAYRP